MATRASRKSPVKKSAAKTPAAKRKTAKRARPGMSDAAVKAKTGKTWKQWFDVLDKAGAKAMAHRDIAALLHARHKVGDWWSQMVTVGYERARGLRKLNQTAEGFRTSVSKTLATGLDAAFTAWDDARQRAGFLKEAVSISTRNPGKNLRFAWSKDGGRVEVRFTKKGPKKAQVTVDHQGLLKAADVKKMKAYWSGVMGKVQTAAAKLKK